MMSAARSIDPIKDRKLFDKAGYILARGGDLGRVQVSKLQRTEKGYYRADYSDAQVTVNGVPMRDTALVDLGFPFSEEDVLTLIHRYRNEPGLELFLSFGPGRADIPKSDDHDPQENARAFFVVDQAFGHVRGEDKTQDALRIEHHVTASEVPDELPQRTFFFNYLPIDEVQDMFDIVQVADVISEPRGGIYSKRRGEVSRFVGMIKPETGRLLILNTYSSSVYPIERVKEEAEKIGCTVEILFNVTERAEDASKLDKVLPQDIMQQLESGYHIGRGHFAVSSDGYAVIIRKPSKSGSQETQ